MLSSIYVSNFTLCRPSSQHRREEKSKKSYGDRAGCVRARPKPKPADHHHSEFVFIFSVSSFTRFTNIAFCSVHVAASLSRSKKQKQTASSRSAARFHLSFCRVFFKLENAKQNEMPAATLHACYFDINLNFFFSSRRSAPNTCTRQAELSKAGERKKLLG